MATTAVQYDESVVEQLVASATESDARAAIKAERKLGHSHNDITLRFARGDQKGKGSRVFIEGDLLFSYGHHFTLAARGDWGRGVRFIVNGDKYSISTSGHTNLAIRNCTPNVQIPYSALHAAGLTAHEHGLMPRRDLRVIDYASDETHYLCRLCGHELHSRWELPSGIEPLGDAEHYHADGTPVCPSPDDKEPYRTEHVLGGVLVNVGGYGGNHYLSGIDTNEPWRLRVYFLCQLPRPCESIADAYAALKPERVAEAERQSLEVRRQGDVFLIRRDDVQFGSITDWRKERDARLWDGSTHRASRLYVRRDGLTLVGGWVRHDRKQHRQVLLGGALWEVVKNTALASWNAVGNVD